MADLHRQPTRTPTRTNPITAFLSNLYTHSPNSTQMLGILTLIITVAILLFLAGITLTATVLGLIFFSPIILISSPVWIPLAIFFFVTVASVLGLCGTGLSIVAVGSWMYKYFKGMNPPGAGRVDYARSRIADTAGQVKDYAKEYGGYLQRKVKDAAPGA
uniref:Oleosin n=1 Tax=Kalanchoe fedtschenkoi TaxID=63787 RepID=A0A7N1A651_KALFE